MRFSGRDSAGAIGAIWATVPVLTALLALMVFGSRMVGHFRAVAELPAVARPDAGDETDEVGRLLARAAAIEPEPAAGPREDEGPPVEAEVGKAAPSCPATVQGLEDVAADLMGRRERLAAREGKLDLREAALAEAERQLARRADELDGLRRQLQDELGQLAQQDDARIVQLVKVYETMKPKQAAEVFDRLDLELLTRVASRMREVKTAAVLAAMDPEKAKRVTMELARRRSPVPTGG